MCGVVLLSSYTICLGWDVWCCSTQLLQYLPRLGCVVLFYSALTLSVSGGMCGVVLLSSYNICLGWDVWCCSTQLLQYLPRWDVWCCSTQLLQYLPRLGCVVLFYSALTISASGGMCGVVLLSSYNICLGWDVWCCSTQLLQYLPRLGCVVLFYSALTISA